jgi:hypothetical protein
MRALPDDFGAQIIENPSRLMVEIVFVSEALRR